MHPVKQGNADFVFVLFLYLHFIQANVAAGLGQHSWPAASCHLGLLQYCLQNDTTACRVTPKATNQDITHFQMPKSETPTSG